MLQTDVSHIDVTGFNGTPETGATADDTECFNLLTPGGNIVSTSRKHEDNSGTTENWYTFNKDYNGSTTSIISSSGSAVSTHGYDAYGNITEISDDIDNEVCYTGQIYDEGTGLYYYNARYYDSEGACFTSMDTYRGDNMIPLTLNLYMYCAGDPINYTGPTGHGFLKKLFKKLGFSKTTKKSNKWTSKSATKKASHKATAGKRKKSSGSRIKNYVGKIKKKAKSIKKTIKEKGKAVTQKIKTTASKTKKTISEKAASMKSRFKKTERTIWNKGTDAKGRRNYTKGGIRSLKAINGTGYAMAATDMVTGVYDSIKEGKDTEGVINDAIVNATFIAAGIVVGAAAAFFIPVSVGAVTAAAISFSASAIFNIAVDASGAKDWYRKKIGV